MTGVYRHQWRRPARLRHQWIPGRASANVTITQPAPGILNLTAGTHAASWTGGVTATVGVLNLGAGTHSFTEALSPSVGILNLGAGTHAVSSSAAITQSSPGILNLGAGTHSFTEALAPPVGIINLTAGVHTLGGDIVGTGPNVNLVLVDPNRPIHYLIGVR